MPSAKGHTMSESVLDPAIPKTLMDSMKEAFLVQASTNVEIVKASAIDSHQGQGAALIAAIGIKSSALNGTLAICFPKECFLGIVNKMLGEKYTDIDKDNVDAAGEMLNIIYASARVKINQLGHDFAPAIPTVTRGSSIQISHGSAPKIVRVDCKCEYGSFHLEVSLRKV